MYTFTSRVRYSETDTQGDLSVTGILNYMQDCSTMQSEDLGIGVGYLKEHQIAWWLSSWQVVITRAPHLSEEIMIGTNPYEIKGGFAYRNFVIRDMEGNNLVKANSVWFLYDLAAGRPMKITEEYVEKYHVGTEEKLDMEYAPRRIEIPAAYEEGMPVTVAKHHLDSNHHVNNAQYIEIARESLPDTVILKQLRAEYKKAAVLNDIICPRIGRTGNDYVVNLCDIDGKSYAVVQLMTAEKER